MSIENNLESIAKSLAALVQLAAAGTTKAETSEATAASPKKPGRPAKPKPAPQPEPQDDGDSDPFDSGDEGGDDAFGDDDGAETEKELTADDVRAALTGLQGRTDAATAIEIMKKYGGTNALSKIPAEKYQAVIDAAKKQTKKLAKS